MNSGNDDRKGCDADVDKETYDELVEFVQVCAGDGYISTRATARDLLDRLGIPRQAR